MTAPQPTPTAQLVNGQWMDFINGQWIPVPPAPQMYAPQQQTPQTQYPQQMPPMGYPGPGMPQTPGLPSQPPQLTGSFEDFFNQKSQGGGRFLKFKDKPNGTSYWGIVARPLVKGDVRAATLPRTNIPQPQRDGSIKWQLLVPLLTMPSTDHPDGRATMVVSGDSRDKLNAAMAAVGAPEHPSGGYVPEAGAFIQITKEREVPVPGLNNQYIYKIDYRGPHDPWTIQKKAEIDAAHQQLASNPPVAAPGQPIWNGQAYVPPTPQAAPATPDAYAHYQANHPHTAPPPAAPIQSAPIATQPAVGALTVPPVTTPPQPIPNPAQQPPASPNAEEIARTQAAAQYVTTADAHSQPPTAPAPAALQVPAPGGSQPHPGPQQAPGGQGAVPQITEDQWRKMRPEQVAAIVTATGARPDPAWNIPGVPA